MINKLFECKYGYFSKDGQEYIITRPDTPRPWINVISNGDYGITAGQTGTGFSWLSNSNLNRITRFSQDMVEDNMGKFIYIRDEENGDYWSAGWKPVCRKPEYYECRHGFGYSVITSEYHGIRQELTMFVSADEPVELWILKLVNTGVDERKMCLFSYLEWNLGVYNVENREFQKIFINNEFNEEVNSFFATKRLWEVPNKKGQNLNSDWNYTAFHSVNETPLSFDGDRESFIGMYGSKASPIALQLGTLARNCGKWVDSIASLQLEALLQPDEEKTFVFVTGVASDKVYATSLIKKYKDVNSAYDALSKVRSSWKARLESNTIETPDIAMNIFTNNWLKYQTISCRLWSRTAYYQSGGAYGFRDQLQDSQIFLSYRPELTKQQILLHAGHQYKNGTVKHWWQPLTEEGPDSSFSDDLLWLPFIVNSYLRETADFSILDEDVTFLDGGIGTLYEHCKKSLDRAFHRFSPRGLPLIGEADWNDGLSGCGTEWIGESLWVGEFLHLILNDFTKAMDYMDDKSFMERCRLVAQNLKHNINSHGWDGEWYIQGTTDTGKVLGSKNNKEGRIFLNPQTWAILSDVAPPDRMELIVLSVEKYLLGNYGALLLYPAYSSVDSDIGYLTRYAPGLRENGGVYSHAAVWALQAFCKLKKPESAYDLYKKLCTVNRSMNIESYIAEPYVMPGNTDGPDSPNYGRGGWTWYTGSAAWLFKVTNEYMLGVRPEYDGLLIDPCIPAEWKGYRVKRIFRNAEYHIEVQNPKNVSFGVSSIFLNGERIEGNILPVCTKDSDNEVLVILG